MTGVGSRVAPWWLFASAIFVSAFLIFQVQPLIGRFVLPWFGGTPAVWTTCMLFFQAVLFGGYAYAHVLNTYAKPRSQFVLHALLLAAAAVMLPIEPSAAWKPTGSDAPTLKILGLLAVTVGLPYFVLASTGPLMQAWFSRTNPNQSPYPLYSLSNVGSVLGLVTYPFVFEPKLTLSSQATAWSVAFVAFALMCGWCGFSASRLKSPEPSADLLPDPNTGGVNPAQLADEIPTPFSCTLWVLLAACGTTLLLASTNQVCLDIAVIPFLWVLPLTLYLVSFILVFAGRWGYPRWLFLPLMPLCLLAVLMVTVNPPKSAFVGDVFRLISFGRLDFAKSQLPEWLQFSLNDVSERVGLEGSDTSMPMQILAHFTALFVCCMVCHGEMVRLKPGPKYLTSFYLAASFGGALGGVFVGVIAPYVFDRYIELPLGLVATCITVALAVGSDSRFFLNRSPWAYAWAPIAIVLLMCTRVFYQNVTGRLDDELARVRNFYGTLHVGDVPAHARDDFNSDGPFVMGDSRKLIHGRILHGQQFLHESQRAIPTTYYVRDSGLGLALQHIRKKGTKRIGMVGLGVGTFAAYGEEGDYVKIYEINPQVLQMAEKYFFFLSECRERGADLKIAMGDARLSLEQELKRNENQQFDLLALDAFSSDAIPVHLITREAFDIYKQHLKPGGVIAVHISNRHFFLHPVVRGAAAHVGMKVKSINCYIGDDDARDPDELGSSSTWMLVSSNDELLNDPEIAEQRDGEEPDIPPVLWTDDYSNIAGALRSLHVNRPKRER